MFMVILCPEINQSHHTTNIYTFQNQISGYGPSS